MTKAYPAVYFVAAVLSFAVVPAAFAGGQASPAPLEGIADIHLHQMDYLGFGGSIIWGEAFGNPQSVLAPVPAAIRRGHNATDAAAHTRGIFESLLFVIATVMPDFLGDFFTHREDGYPGFRSWPSHSRWSHQQVYEDWLFRAYQGGLRLIVMLATNSEDMFGRGENTLPLFRSRVFQRVKAPGRTGNDMEALEWQVRQAYRMQAHIDAKYNGRGWYRIVRDPEEAGAVIARGEMAVILGSELQHLFNCDMDRPACTEETIVEGLNRLEAMGVNYVFPVHHKLNQFGGPAAFIPLNSGPMQHCDPYRHKCSTVGLKDPGRFLIDELMARGMLIDTEHLSRLAFADAMTIFEARRYPVLASHVVSFELTMKAAKTERARNGGELKRIVAVGGMVAPLLGAPAGEYSRPGAARVPVSCKIREGGGVDQWANAYLFMRDLAPPGQVSGHIAIGSDWNGFAGWPGPREKCKPPEGPVTYPFALPPGLVPAAAGAVDRMERFDWPAGVRQWDFNKVGLAHAGMLPDFLENVRLLGLTHADLEPIYRSARAVVDLWSAARNNRGPRDRHHLRWTPQSPFDVLEFEPAFADASRTLAVQPGFNICRSRGSHHLGFERNNRCDLVEDAKPAAAQAVAVSGYHAGRCLDIRDASSEGRVVQRPCSGSPSQRWLARPLSGGYYELVNERTGNCLAAGFKAEASAELQPCARRNEQQWQARRTGNTFSLIARHSGLCLEVRQQSRADGAAIQQNACTGASHQLWQMESLRSGDFERLYQAAKGQSDWFDRPPSGYIPVTVDEEGARPICRSVEARSLGVVTGNQCRGKTIDGMPVTTDNFQQLYQRP